VCPAGQSAPWPPRWRRGPNREARELVECTFKAGLLEQPRLDGGNVVRVQRPVHVRGRLPNARDKRAVANHPEVGQAKAAAGAGRKGPDIRQRRVGNARLAQQVVERV